MLKRIICLLLAGLLLIPCVFAEEEPTLDEQFSALFKRYKTTGAVLTIAKDGEIIYLDVEVKTGMFSYSVGGRCGLMDANCRRLTAPLYYRIIAVDKNMYRALLLDGYSEVILNAKGEVMK